MNTPETSFLMVIARAVACFVLVPLTGCTTASLPEVNVSAPAGVAAGSIDCATTSPTPTYMMRPVYPPEMRSDRLEGLVHVHCLVDATGRVCETEVIETSHEDFVRPVIYALQRWRFTPTLVDGKPVANWVSIPIQFKLAD